MLSPAWMCLLYHPMALQPSVQLLGNEAWAINPVPIARERKWVREGNGSEKIEEAVGGMLSELWSLWWSENAPSPESSPPNPAPRDGGGVGGKPSHHTHTLCFVKWAWGAGAVDWNGSMPALLVVIGCFWVNYYINMQDYFQCDCSLWLIFYFVPVFR